MKIISYGHLEQKRLTCPNCETIMEYDSTDTEKLLEEWPENDMRIVRTFVICPVCREPIELGGRGYEEV